MKKHFYAATDRFQITILGLFNLLVLTVPLFFMLNTEELFEFNKMILTYFITILICGVWAARMVVQKRLIFRSTKLDVPVLIFLLSQLLSTIFSIHPYTSLLGYYTRFHGGLVSIFCYAALYYAFVSNVEKKHLKSFFISMMAAGVLTSIYGTLEHFGHSFSCTLATGGQSFGVDCWVQDVKNRVFATFGQPNWFAAYLLMLIPLGLTFTVATKKRWLQIALIAMNILFFATILFTRSRSGILGLAGGLVFFFPTLLFIFWQEYRGHWKEATGKQLPVIATIAIFFVMALVINSPLSEALSKYFPKKNASPLSSMEPSAPTAAPTPSEAPTVNRLENGITDSGDIRKIVWTGAIRVWKRYPIFGSGVETFGYSYYQDRPVEHNNVSEWDFLYNKAHNEFLNFLATTGLVGFLAYCGLLSTFFFLGLQRLWRFAKAKDLYAASLCTALIAGTIGLSISNFFGFSTVMVTILLFLFFGILDLLVVEKEDEIPLPRELASWQYTVLVLIGLLSITLVYRTYSYWKADMEYTKAKALLQQGYAQDGLPLMMSAIQRTPQEALFYDELALDYAAYAVQFAQAGQATPAAELAAHATEAQNLVLQLNPRQLNFYKSGARVYLTLAQVDSKYLSPAQKILENAQPLAPTDPKIVYNLGLIAIAMKQPEKGVEYLQKTLVLKPDYDAVRMQLAQEYEKENKLPEALEQYTYLAVQRKATDPTIQQKIDELTEKMKTKK